MGLPKESVLRQKGSFLSIRKKSRFHYPFWITPWKYFRSPLFSCTSNQDHEIHPIPTQLGRLLLLYLLHEKSTSDPMCYGLFSFLANHSGVHSHFTAVDKRIGDNLHCHSGNILRCPTFFREKLHRRPYFVGNACCSSKRGLNITRLNPRMAAFAAP